MKYSFRLDSTGPPTKLNANWGLPLNLQVCRKCSALNHKSATQCTKCSQPLSEPVIGAGNPVASAPAAVAEHLDLSQNKTAAAAIPTQAPIQEPISDATPQSPANTANSANSAYAAASQSAPAAAGPTPDTLMAHRQFVVSNEQKWLRLAWGAVLLLILLAATGLLIYSLQPPPSTSSDAAKDANNYESANDGAMPAPEPAQQSADTRTSTETTVIENSVTQPAAQQDSIRTVPPAPVTPVIPVIPVIPAPVTPESQQQESAAPVNVPCSEAARALALCDENAN